MKRAVCVLGAVLVILGLTSCANKYGAVIYDNAREWIKEEFAENNRVWEYYEGEEQFTGSYPSSRSFLVKDEQRFKEIFVEEPQGLEVNFENEMLAVYTFRAIYIRNMKIDSVKVESDTVGVYLEYAKAKVGVGDAVAPYQRWVVVKMDKLDVSELDMGILK